MIIRELTSVVFDKIIIYKANAEGFENIYKGDTNDIPEYLLEMKVKSIGASRKGVIDIQVF